MDSNSNSDSQPNPMGGAGNSVGGRRATLKRMAIALSILVVVSLALGGAYWYFAKAPTDEQLTQVEQIQRQITEENDPAKKSLLYTELSAAQQLEGDFDEALQSTQQAVEVAESVSAYAQLALMYEEMKEYQLAIEYYNRAAELSEPTDNPNEYTDYTYYKGRADYLETQL